MRSIASGRGAAEVAQNFVFSVVFRARARCFKSEICGGSCEAWGRPPSALVTSGKIGELAGSAGRGHLQNPPLQPGMGGRQWLGRGECASVKFRGSSPMMMGDLAIRAGSDSDSAGSGGLCDAE